RGRAGAHRRRRARAPRAVRGRGRAPRRRRWAERAVGAHRRLGAAPGRGGRGGAGSDRRGQGAGADLEARGGRVGERHPSADRLATSVARAVVEERRAELLAGATDDPDLVERAAARLAPSLRRVINATGVIVHTNLGRAPLGDAARAAVARATHGYSNLELDL